MRRKSRSTTRSASVQFIECPLDLDSLILSPDGGNAEFLDSNLNVSEEILENAISLSAYAGWLLNHDVFSRLSFGVRASILRSLHAFSPIVAVCFLVRATSLAAHDPVRQEVEKHLDRNPSAIGRDALGLFNPLSRLNNPSRELDLSILRGQTSLVQTMRGQVEKFVQTKDKSDIDFSGSVFLPDILNPRFFMGLDEGERLVVMGMCWKYFSTCSTFMVGNWSAMGSWPRMAGRRVNIVQALLKWTMMSDMCSMRVKMMAYGQLLKEIVRIRGKGSMMSDATKVLDREKMRGLMAREQKELNDKEVSPDALVSWLNNPEGLFESFELDCTLHSLDATHFWLEVLIQPNIHLAEGMMEFQDEDTRAKLLLEIGDAMTVFR